MFGENLFHILDIKDKTYQWLARTLLYLKNNWILQDFTISKNKRRLGLQC